LIAVGARGELETAVANGLEQSGYGVRLLTREQPWQLDGCDFLILCGPMQSMNWVIQRLTRITRGDRARRPLAVWFTEQVPRPTSFHLATRLGARLRHAGDDLIERMLGALPPTSGPWRRLAQRSGGYAGRLRALGELLALRDMGFLQHVGVFSHTSRAFLRRHGVPASVLPMGSAPIFGGRQGCTRDIDVVFLGSTRDRRRGAAIRTLEQALARRGIRFVIRDGSPARGYAFSDERTTLLNRTKIMLGLVRQPWDDGVFRMLLAAPNGAFVLSEQLLSTSLGPFRAGEHFAMADLRQLPDTIEFYLRHDRERQQIAESAYTYVTTELTMAAMARRLVDTLLHRDGDRASEPVARVQ
jgi:hypothetical protein